METAFVVAAAFVAGLIDAMVGGGGLVLLPALFSAYPAAQPAALIGTNKAAGIWGTAVAAGQYARRVRLPWDVLLPAAGCALLGSGAGAWTLTVLDPGFLRRSLPFALAALLLYTLARRNLGSVHARRHGVARETATACAVSAALGWYDGFFGPGTGSLLVFAFVRLLGWDFLHAAAASKVVNTATNAAALALLAAKGQVWWQLGLLMAVANVGGSLLGTRLALKHGAGFVRGVFIVVVGALIVKTGYDAFLR